jgi:hypothetical protein
MARRGQAEVLAGQSMDAAMARTVAVYEAAHAARARRLAAAY